MADCETSLQQQLGDISETELVPESPEYCHEDDVGRELQIVERCSSAFSESTPACPAVVDPATEGGPGLPS